eukprot:scaffold3319_cov258-Pinguiococcus_pyrenoidosus.AAC.8
MDRRRSPPWTYRRVDTSGPRSFSGAVAASLPPHVLPSLLDPVQSGAELPVMNAMKLQLAMRGGGTPYLKPDGRSAFTATLSSLGQASYPAFHVTSFSPKTAELVLEKDCAVLTHLHLRLAKSRLLENG